MYVEVKVKELRKSRNLTQEGLAEEIGVTRITITNWENNTIPTLEGLYKLKKAFGCTLDDLITFKGNDPTFGEDDCLFIKDRDIIHSIYEVACVNVWSNRGGIPSGMYPGIDTMKFYYENSEFADVKEVRYAEVENAIKDRIKEIFRMSDDEAKGMWIFDFNEKGITLTPVTTWGDEDDVYSKAFIEWAKGDIPGICR